MCPPYTIKKPPEEMLGRLFVVEAEV